MPSKVNSIWMILFILLNSSFTFAQNPILERLKKIDRLLQPSEEFHEISDKQSLIITERYISRTLYHQLVSSNMLRNQNGLELPKNTLQSLTGKLIEGSLLFSLEKYYDGEIENLYTIMTGANHNSNYTTLTVQTVKQRRSEIGSEAGNLYITEEQKIFFNKRHTKKSGKLFGK